MKKIILFAIVVACVSFIAKAQQVEGLWSFYPTKASTAGIVYESIGDEVFYMSGSNLFSYEKESGNITSYHSGNYLSDNTIKNIYYNYGGGYLLVVYENSNIDFIYPDKRVVNVPDLMNRVTMSSKVINDVAFAENRVYAATDFGLIILDDTRHEVYKSYIYNAAISKVAVTDENIIALINNKLYIANVTDNLLNFNTAWVAVDMGAISPTTVHHLYAINDNTVLFVFDSSAYTYNLTEKCFVEQSSAMAAVKLISTTRDGLLFSYDDRIEFVLRTLADTGALQIEQTLAMTNSQVKNGYYSCYNEAGSIWACSASGISHFTLEGSNLTWLVKPVAYNSSSVVLPQSLLIHNNKVYVKNMGAYHFSVDMSTATVISVLDLNTREWSNMSLDKVVRGGNTSSLGVLRSSYNLAFDPDSSEVMYVGSWFDGLHKFAGSKYVGNYNKTNSPLASPWAMLDSFSAFDGKGNLWTVMVSNSLSNYTVLACLPADKKVINPAACKKEDWKTYLTGSATEFFNYMTACKKSPHVIFVHGKQVSRNRISVLNSETEVMRTFTEFTTQEGNKFGSAVHYFYTATEDNNGDVWIGTSEGVIVLPDIENYMDADYACIQVKCYNEATGQYEYLLADNYVTVIAVDSFNRKWIGTNEDGVYLVNEDGSRILGHYTPDNSLLPSPVIYGIDVNRATNEVFIATAKGVASFLPQSGNVSITSYDDVIVLPNPVLPDYKGWITIQGLIDDSTVKITDVEGNIYSQGVSTGSIYKWDGRTATGERVATGTYLVYASHDGGEARQVAKIRIVN